MYIGTQAEDHVIDSKSTLPPPTPPRPPPPTHTHTYTHSPVIYATDRFKVVVLVLFFLCMALWFLLRAFHVESCIAVCFRVFSSPFSIVITSLWKERAGLCVFEHLFVYCARVGFVLLFLLISGVGCGL